MSFCKYRSKYDIQNVDIIIHVFNAVRPHNLLAQWRWISGLVVYIKCFLFLNDLH